MPGLDRWDSFYEIVGSAAGALIGLQFVVMTLVAQRPSLRAADAAAAFATPTIFHFSTVLLLAALLRAPWDGVAAIAAILAVIGLAGLAYMLITMRRMHAQTAYRPDFEDLLFHAVLPLAAYAVLAASAFAAASYARETMFAVGGGTLLLLFCGIHNAWDAVSYHVLMAGERNDRNTS